MMYVLLALTIAGLVLGLVWLVRRDAHGRGNAQTQSGADGYTADSGNYATPFWTSGSDSAGSLDPGPGGFSCDTGGGSDSGGYDSGGGDSGGCDSGGGDGGGGGGGGGGD